MSIVRTSCTLAGRELNTTTRSASCTASSISWVTKKMVLRSVCQIRSNSPRMMTRVTESRRAEGLIEIEDVGVDCECAGYLQPLLHAPREIGRIGIVRNPAGGPFEHSVRCASRVPRATSLDSPNPIFPSTVSQGKTPRSWKTRMRRGSGPADGFAVDGRLMPLGRRKKPPITFSSVDLPQPEGPTRQMNSPSATSRLISSSTDMLLPSRSNTMPSVPARNFPARQVGSQ